MGVVVTILLFLIILSILVLVHEAGHFFAARLFGVHVDEFGLGFPPRAKGWKRGAITYSLNWLPLGGFVKLKGEQGEAAQEPDSFAAQTIGKRLIILVAGVAMNGALAIVLFTFGFMIGMPQVVDTDDAIGGDARMARIQIVNILPNSPAQKAGIQLGDVIIELNNESYDSITAVQNSIAVRGGESVDLVLQRGRETARVSVIPVRAAEGDPARIGVGLAKTAIVSYPLHEAFVRAVKTTWALTVGIFALLGTAVSRREFDGFVGPVGIAAYTATAAQLGFAYVINLMAQLSVSLAVINVLPIPALDGGRALFVLVEKVRGKALRAHFENAIHLVGFFTLILLLLLVTVRDIGRLFPL